MPVPAARYSSAFSVSGAPVITSVAPIFGPTTGGTVVTALGSNFSGASQVLFGTVPAASFSASANSFTATAPVLPGGAAPATVSYVGALGNLAGTAVVSLAISPAAVGH